MGCGHTGEKTNEINPDQIQVTSNKNKNNINSNQNNQETSVKKEDVLIMKQINKSKTKKFINDALKKHNELRAQHNAEPLIISEDLNKIAQKYAEHLAKIKKMEHSNTTYKGEDLGENLFCCSGNEIQGETMTISWYDVIEKYNFNEPGFVSGTGHFTQVVWKDSKEVGFGFALSDNGVYYGVANYYPAGNINTKEEFSNNVSRKKL